MIEIEPASVAGADGLAVRGELDAASVGVLELALREAVVKTEGAFVLDLCELEFLDTGGVHVLLLARSLLGRSERSLAVVCPPGPARRVLELVGIAELLRPYDDRDAAARELIRR